MKLRRSSNRFMKVIPDPFPQSPAFIPFLFYNKHSASILHSCNLRQFLLGLMWFFIVLKILLSQKIEFKDSKILNIVEHTNVLNAVNTRIRSLCFEKHIWLLNCSPFDVYNGTHNSMLAMKWLLSSLYITLNSFH